MRRVPLILSGFAISGLIGAAYLPQKLAYNPTPSAPKGLYWITEPVAAKRDDLIITSVPKAFNHFVVERGYLAPNIPLIKRIVALEGDTICSLDRRIFVNGKHVATALKTDSMGRVMPHWSGCLTLDDRQFFALMTAPDSLDSRYFGPLNVDQIVGTATPIWTVNPTGVSSDWE